MFQLACLRLLRLHKNGCGRVLTSVYRFASDDVGQDDPKKETDTRQKAKKRQDGDSDGGKPSASLNRLNELLALMSTENEVQLVKKAQLAMPQSKKRSKKRTASDSDSDSDVDERPKDLAKAAKNVADALGGDARKTETELLGKLLGTSEASAGTGSLNDIISGMAVDKDSPKGKEKTVTRSTLVRKAVESRTRQRGISDEHGESETRVQHQRPERRRFIPKPQPVNSSVKLFDEEPLGIFTDVGALNNSPDILKTWQKLHERELRLAVTHPPSNYFQKMALWTEQGKLWKFPIDNEQGREEEAKVSFTEHVFLEEHLEPWCPSKGPVRHFMELVCVGLSKNHYITAQEKRDHIFWFRDYFEQKKDLLQEIIQQGEQKQTKQLDK